MKITVLLENTSRDPRVKAQRGMSLYIETAKHKVLFDMGAGPLFLENAAALGVDLAAVDTAVLSHGHSDHGGGLAAFCAVNKTAPVYVHPAAFADQYALTPGQEPEYIGVPALRELRERLVLTESDVTPIDAELTLFSGVGDALPVFDASAKLRLRTPEGEFPPDPFAHEQHLLVTEGDKTALFAGCGHKGMPNILARAREVLGREPEAVFGGFHLFQTVPGDPKGDALIAATAQALRPGKTAYYTCHCTGDYALEKLSAVLGGRIHAISGGSAVEL